jgi:DtxR family Mn-dependent transcriptional regulator
MQLVKSNNGAREPSEVVSRYLEAIYYMWAEKEPLRSSRLADWLGVSRPTVAIGLRRMTRDGLVLMNSRKEIELTDAGKQTAESIVRRHRIMERWLTDGLGLDWVTADAEAARLEHAVSDVVERRLYEVLGRPQTCPHGNPIPGYSDPVADETRLSSLKAGDRASITRVSEVAEREAPPLLAYLHQRDLTPRREVQVLETDEVGKTLRVAVAGREVTLSHETASKIWAILTLTAGPYCPALVATIPAFRPAECASVATIAHLGWLGRLRLRAERAALRRDRDLALAFRALLGRRVCRRFSA